MSRLKKYLSGLFGYTRRERRGTIILFIILLLVFIIRYYFLTGDSEKLTITPLPAIDKTAGNNTDTLPVKALFTFDPNNATRDDLLSLGLSNRQASTLIKYRKAGAKFYAASDLFKVYGMDSQLVLRLVPYINIKITPKESHLPYQKSADTLFEVKQKKVTLLIDLNKCTSSDLELLPGIGPVLSERIIKYRSLLGGYVSPVQLNEVYGIDSSCVGKIRNMVFADPGSIKKIHLDSCSYADLAKHPYIGSSLARAIIKYRDLMGPPSDAGELVRQKVIDSVAYNRIRYYCLFP